MREHGKTPVSPETCSLRGDPVAPNVRKQLEAALARKKEVEWYTTARLPDVGAAVIFYFVSPEGPSATARGVFNGNEFDANEDGWDVTAPIEWVQKWRPA
jgi:hypothetical protein